MKWVDLIERKDKVDDDEFALVDSEVTINLKYGIADKKFRIYVEGGKLTFTWIGFKLFISELKEIYKLYYK